MNRKGLLECLIWIMRKIKITWYHFRWCPCCYSKDAVVWKHVSPVFLHEPLSSWVISFSDLKNISGVTSCILFSLHRPLQPKKQTTLSYEYQAKVSVAAFFFFNIFIWHLLVYVRCCRLLSSWKFALLSQNRTAKLLCGSTNECLWISWAGDWGILPGTNSLGGKNTICRKHNINYFIVA